MAGIILDRVEGQGYSNEENRQKLCFRGSWILVETNNKQKENYTSGTQRVGHDWATELNWGNNIIKERKGRKRNI